MAHEISAEYPTNNLDAVSTGRRLLMNVDGRTAWARRFRFLVQAHLDDLGGPDNVSQAEIQIVRRCAALAVELEKLEASFSTAEWDRPSGRASANHLDLYSRLSANLRRLLEALGLQRRSRAIDPGEEGALEHLLSPEQADEFLGPVIPTAATRRAATRERTKKAARRRTR